MLTDHHCELVNNQSDVDEDPAGAERQELPLTEARAEGSEHAKQEGHRKDKDADRDGAEAEVDREEADAEEQREERLELVDLDRQAMVGSAEHLHEGDEVEEDRGGGCGNGNVAPAETVVQGRGQDRERGEAVEEDCDFEPEQRHGLSDDGPIEDGRKL